MATTKTTITTRAKRTSVRPITASSQTTSGTWTRTTTCSSSNTTPITTLISTIAWCTPCVERARRACSSTPGDVISHLIGSSPEQTFCHPRSYSWCILLDSTSAFFLYFSFLSFSVYFLHHELFLELDNPIVMESLCWSVAEKSEGTLNAPHSFTWQRHPRYIGTVTTQGRVWTNQRATRRSDVQWRNTETWQQTDPPTNTIGIEDRFFSLLCIFFIFLLLCFGEDLCLHFFLCWLKRIPSFSKTIMVF